MLSSAGVAKNLIHQHDPSKVGPPRGEETASVRIVAVVLNPFLNDTRVLKQARSLRDAGYEVHVVATWKPGLAFEDEVDGLPVHRVRLSSIAVLDLPRALLSRRLGSLLARRRSAWTPVPEPPPFVAPTSVRKSSPEPQGLSSGTVATTGQSAPEVIPPCTSSRESIIDLRPGLLVRLLRRVWRGARRTFSRGSRGVMMLFGRANGRLTRARSTLRGRCKRLIRWIVVNERLYPSRQIGMNLDLAARVLDLEPDVVHCHDLNTVTAGHLVRRVRGCPVVYDSHELWLERNLAGRSRFWDRIQWSVVERRLIGRCAAVSTVAEGIARHLEKRYAGLERVELIRNVQPWAEPAPRSRLLSEDLGIDPRRRIALYAGGILKSRGIENLIRAAAVGSDRTAWVVMGYASQADYLEELRTLAEMEGVLGSKVFFRDAVSPDEVHRYAASSDVAVVPTQAICLSYEFEASNKIFHSVMARVPVAMSDHIEKRLLNERYGIGVLFDETDPLEIASVVEGFLDDHAAYTAAVERCASAAKDLNWEHEERTLLAMFGRVVAEGVGA